MLTCPDSGILNVGEGYEGNLKEVDVKKLVNIREFKYTQRRHRTTSKIKQMNLYFTYESRNTLKSFALFITVKTITKPNLKYSDKFEKEI